jgi:hypothetical protein
MAENKKSFLLYADLLHTFEELTDDEAGRLIKHLFRYVNDLDPEAPDRLTKIAFEPIMRQLKRDLQKWDVMKEENSKNGHIGNLKRWNVDLYKKYVSKELTLEEAVKLANGRRLSPPDSPPINNIAPLSPHIAKIAVTVNDTVNGNVINDDVYTPSSSVPFYTIHQFENEVSIGQNEFTLHACRSSKHTAEDLEKFLREFIIQQKALTKLTWPNISDAKKHFISWASKQQKSVLINGVVSSPGIRRPLN